MAAAVPRLIIPTTPAAPPAGFTASRSGILVPQASSSIVPERRIETAPATLARSLATSSVLPHVTAGYRQLAATSGRDAANFAYEGAFRLIDRIAADERHAAAIAAFKARRTVGG